MLEVENLLWCPLVVGGGERRSDIATLNVISEDIKYIILSRVVAFCGQLFIFFPMFTAEITPLGNIIFSIFDSIF